MIKRLLIAAAAIAVFAYVVLPAVEFLARA